MADIAEDQSQGVRARQKQETRDRILQAALSQFAEKGFEGASIRDIASQAGVLHGLIKYHFNGKEELWKSAVDFLFERQAAELHDPPGEEQLPPDIRARNWLKRYVRYCARYPEHGRIMAQESIRETDRMKWAVEKHIKPIHERAKRANAHWIAAGVYPDIPQYAIIYIISAAAQAPFMLAGEAKLSEDFDVTDAAVIDAYADALVTFLMDHKFQSAGG